MRILFISNFYPPYELGGQGQSCQQIVEDMRARGHDALVLTSMHGTQNVPTRENNVWRFLYLEMDLTPWRASVVFFTRRKAREQHNLQVLEQVLAEFAPDVIFVWGMWNLHRSLPALAEKRWQGRVLYRFADYWPTLPSQHAQYWRAPGRSKVAKVFKKALAALALRVLAREAPPAALKLEHVICVSAATRDALVNAGIPVSHARIIHTGLDVSAYGNELARKTAEDSSGILRLLYAGRLATPKGVETAIEAMVQLMQTPAKVPVQLDLAGAGDPEYEAHLRALAARKGLAEHVTFLGLIPREEMPCLLKKYDVLLVPSIWQEPFARIVLEGMSAGLVVVATPMGGTVEIVRDEESGLLFTPGDARHLAMQIERLAADPELLARLSQTGRRTVQTSFRVGRMIDAIEMYLLEIAGERKMSSIANEVA